MEKAWSFTCPKSHSSNQKARDLPFENFLENLDDLANESADASCDPSHESPEAPFLSPFHEEEDFDVRFNQQLELQRINDDIDSEANVKWELVETNLNSGWQMCFHYVTVELQNTLEYDAVGSTTAVGL